jgi:hypothetical protein
MNPVLILLALAGAWYFTTQKKGNVDETLDAGYKMQDLLNWGYQGVDQLNETETNLVWDFVNLTRQGDWKNADALWSSKVKAIATKYGITL